MINKWNRNMGLKLLSSCISHLDESICKWVGKFTCPSFYRYPRNPWPLGIEYHIIAWGTSDILYVTELEEGRDKPQQGEKEFNDKGKAVGLLLYLTRPNWGSSKAAVLDSDFCVLRGIDELQKNGVSELHWWRNVTTVLVQAYSRW